MKTRLLIIVGFLFFIPWMLENSADACQYVMSDNTLQEDFDTYDFIFSGKILKVEESAPYTPVTLEIIESWKGQPDAKILFFICKGKSDGGLQFKEGESYLIFAEKLDSAYPVVSDFGPTKLLSEAKNEILFLDQKSNITRFYYDASVPSSLPSPLMQFNSGMSFNEIQCKENLVLVQKYDGMPACVTEQTKTKLIERGWTKTQTKNFATPADSQKLLSLLEAGQVEEFNKLKSSLIISSNPFLSLNGTNLQGLDLRGIDLTRVHIAGTDMQNSNLQGIVLDYKNIKDANLQGADLTGADLSDTWLRNVNLQNANMQNANLKNFHLGDSNLDYANLMGADLRGVDFRIVSMIDVNFEDANMQGTNLSETNLENLNFQGANLQFANLKYATLSGANLKNTNLSNAILENANLRSADLSGANLSGTSLKNADLLNANFTNIKNLPISTEEARQRGAIVN